MSDNGDWKVDRTKLASVNSEWKKRSDQQRNWDISYLLWAIERGDQAKARKYVDDVGVHVDAQGGGYSDTALHVAILEKSVWAAEMCAKLGARTDIKNRRPSINGTGGKQTQVELAMEQYMLSENGNREAAGRILRIVAEMTLGSRKRYRESPRHLEKARSALEILGNGAGNSVELVEKKRMLLNGNGVQVNVGKKGVVGNGPGRATI